MSYVTAIKDEVFLDLLERFVEHAASEHSFTDRLIEGNSIFPEAQNKILKNLLEAGEEKINLQEILQEQNYQGPNKRRFKRLVEELDIKEPIEDLIALLN